VEDVLLSSLSIYVLSFLLTPLSVNTRCCDSTGHQNPFSSRKDRTVQGFVGLRLENLPEGRDLCTVPWLFA